MDEFESTNIFDLSDHPLLQEFSFSVKNHNLIKAERLIVELKNRIESNDNLSSITISLENDLPQDIVPILNVI